MLPFRGVKDDVTTGGGRHFQKVKLDLNKSRSPGEEKQLGEGEKKKKEKRFLCKSVIGNCYFTSAELG